jgi:hypothetical protein
MRQAGRSGFVYATYAATDPNVTDDRSSEVNSSMQRFTYANGIVNNIDD